MFTEKLLPSRDVIPVHKKGQETQVIGYKKKTKKYVNKNLK